MVINTLGRGVERGGLTKYTVSRCVVFAANQSQICDYFRIFYNVYFFVLACSYHHKLLDTLLQFYEYNNFTDYHQSSIYTYYEGTVQNKRGLDPKIA